MGDLCHFRIFPKYIHISTGLRSQKDLDTSTYWSIIIFTDTGHGRPGLQASDTPRAGNAKPAAESRPRRAVSRRRILRSPRSGPGQVRDVATRTDRGQVCRSEEHTSELQSRLHL